jgi:hypothetical protein
MNVEDKYRNLKKILGSEQKVINRYLRKGVRNDKPTEKVISEINLTLDAAPAYNNNLVHHCGFIGQASVKELAIWFGKRVGMNIQIPNFLSTTKDAAHFFNNQEKVFEIHTSANSNGKDVTTLDFKKPNEGEITFKNGTFFEIVEAEPDLITLKELSEIPEKYEILGEDYFMEDEEVREYFKEQDSKQPKIKSLTDQGII